MSHFERGQKVIVVRPFHATNRHVGEVMATGVIQDGPDRGKWGCDVRLTDVTDPHAPARYWIPAEYLHHNDQEPNADDTGGQP